MVEKSSTANMWNALVFLILIAVGTASQPEQNQQPIHADSKPKSPFDADFDVFVELTLQVLHVPGLSIAVVDHGEVYSKGYGFAHLPNVKATADTQYFTGSTTKAFTAAAAALLVHDEQYPDLKWTSPIADFLPADFALEDAHATSHTTIEDALSHRSGLPRHDLMYGQLHDTPSSVVQRIRHLPMTAEPRTIFQYCNIMFGVITDLIETVRGQKLETVLRQNFWEPLGMASTTFTMPQSHDSSRLARGYFWDPPTSDQTTTSKGQYVAEPYIDIGPISGAGATISTVNDYALWIKAWLDAPYSQNSSSPITRRIFRDLLSPRTIISGLGSDDGLHFISPPLYGLGWLTTKILGETLVFHNGGLTGFGTELYMLPEQGYGVITMGNTAETSNDAGAMIAGSLLLQKLDEDGGQDTSASDLKSSLLHLTRRSLDRRLGRRESLSRSQGSTLEVEALPLPGSITDFAGQYSHQAYGTVNFTVTASRDSASEKILEGLFYPRTWPTKVQLFHESDTVFAVKACSPHGIGDIVSGEDIVWEDVSDEDDRAVFQLGLNGVVERIGLPLEPSMADAAAAKGEKYWSEGLIWLDKV